MRARFDGTCIKCGKRIIGWQTSPSEACSDIGWRRRGETYGLDSVAWHTECNYMSDDMGVIAILKEKQKDKKPFHPSYVPAPAHVVAMETAKYPIESVPTPETENAMNNGMTPEMIQEMITKAVQAATGNGPVVSVPVTLKPVTTKGVTLRSNWWEKLDAAIDCGLTRILLVGPPGTGKSTTADRDGLRVTCHEDSGPESMIGTFIQKDGNTIWIDGPSVVAMKKGSRIVKDEIDHTSPECISLLYALLDDSPSIMLPTGEYVKAAKGYQVICTSNANPGDLPDAILDRIEAVIVADIPHHAAVNSVKVNSGTDGEKLVALMHNYYRGLDKSGFLWKGSPTLRRVRNFGKLLSAGLNKDVASELVFGKAAKEILSALTTASV